jgi:GMP synthase-like glutamine amidotransferase
MYSPLRIAVLECDTPIDKVNRRYNGYGGVFRMLLKASANALNQPERLDPETGMEITAWDIVNDDKYPKLEDVDAVLLTGSSTYQLGDSKHFEAYTNPNDPKPEHNSFEDIPWINRLVEFTQQVLAQDRVRLLGICFGHQIVGRALGSKVGRSDQGWEIAVCDMDLTDKGKEFFGRDKIVSFLCLRLVSQEATHASRVHVQPADLIFFTANSASSKCTGILSLIIPRMWFLSAHPRAALYRVCMYRAALSPFRAILNSRETLPQRLFRDGPRPVFLRRTKLRML